MPKENKETLEMFRIRKKEMSDTILDIIVKTSEGFTIDDLLGVLETTKMLVIEMYYAQLKEPTNKEDEKIAR